MSVRHLAVLDAYMEAVRAHQCAGGSGRHGGEALGNAAGSAGQAELALHCADRFRQMPVMSVKFALAAKNTDAETNAASLSLLAIEQTAVFTERCSLHFRTILCWNITVWLGLGLKLQQRR